jgi:succinyl-diaminopimelate desuccinylase
VSSTDLLALTEDLCRVPSVSGTEDELAGVVEHWLATHASSLAVERIGANVVARTRGGAEARVVLGGHLDTVPANNNAMPRRDGHVLHGLGSADMKGGVAIMLDLASALAHAEPSGLRRDVTLVFYEGEEVADDLNGLRRLFSERPDLVQGDLAMLLEPTGGWVEAGCQGTIHVRAVLHGQRAHSARPWMGVNAIHQAVPLLARVAAFESESVMVDGLEYREALQVVRMNAGVANNVIPDRCELVINRRYAPSRSLDDAIAELRDLCSDADEFEVINASPAAPPNLGDALVAEFVGVHDLGVRPKLGWTDVARFAAHGIPALNFGPGDPTLAHTADERVERADLDGCRRVLRSFLGLPA